jgi:protein-S-isoprenylcysteine O-methyltransferase Ste14
MRNVVLVALIALLAAGALMLVTHNTARQTLVAGLVLAAPAFPLMLLARAQLGRSFSVGPKATALVTNGLYSKIPHPMYVFLDLLLLGVVIALRQPWLVGVWLAIVAVQSWQARRESRVLEQAFGDAYRNYRARTWW